MNESAFPQIVTEYDDSLHEYTNNVHSVGGMTLRDYFAAKAMQARLNAFSMTEWHGWTLKDFAEDAYELADAMMKARGE